MVILSQFMELLHPQDGLTVLRALTILRTSACSPPRLLEPKALPSALASRMLRNKLAPLSINFETSLRLPQLLPRTLGSSFRLMCLLLLVSILTLLFLPGLGSRLTMTASIR